MPPALALVWLGATLLDRDRTMLAERGLERREAASEILARALLQSMGEAERWLSADDVGPPGSAGAPEIPDGVVRLKRSSAGADVFPASRLLWVPEPPAYRNVPDAPFAEAERAEIEGTGDRGLARYASLATSSDPAVRAGALIRLGSAYRRDNKIDQALGAYRELAAVQQIAINRTPVDLVARRMICDILGEAGRKDEAAREAAALGQDLLRPRWVLDRAAWELASADVARWTGGASAPRERQAMSAAVEWAYAEWRQLPGAGRRLVALEDTLLTLVWDTRGSEFRALVIAPTVVDRWIKTALERDLPAPVRVSLVAETGRLVAGSPQETGVRAVSRAPSESGLPWTLVVGPADSSQADAELTAQRRLLGAGVVALTLLLAGGSYLLWRVVRRELSVARLQTDFVAAVSHEFRTPLTSLRHITDLLQENDQLPPGRRESLYGVLGQSTDRLRRLVESLLDFARMEDGRQPWVLVPLDLASLVTEVVESFRTEHPGVTIGVDLPGSGRITVKADTDALTHALWNLLDNAVKYSPSGGVIRISVAERLEEGARGIAIAVTDSGLGIPKEERWTIFERFVRGRKATELGIGGTGLGLAMVSHIVDAHDGRIDLETVEGHGSTFTIVLPALQDGGTSELQDGRLAELQEVERMPS